jgi:dihydropyrimidinase
LPLLFDAMVSKGRMDLRAFVQLTATAPAELFGLTGKGRIAPGADADIAIWDPDAQLTYGADDLHCNTGYNPFAGTTVKGLPQTVLLRGQAIVTDRKLTGKPGQGRRVPMQISAAMAAG